MDKTQTRDERIAELLEQPALDAAKSIQGPSLSDLVQEPEKKADEAIEEEETSTGGKKVRIPVSRLKTLTAKVSELEAQLQESRTYAERVAALEAQLNNKGGEDELPVWWIENYGDNEASRKGYANTKRVQQELLKTELSNMEAQRQAEQAEREARIQSIEQSFDTQMDELEESLGRELTTTQKSEIMDIVGEYSPQEDGKYLAYMDISKAYEIWLKGHGVSEGKQEMARIAGVQSSGSSQVSTDRPQMGDWRRKYNL